MFSVFGEVEGSSNCRCHLDDRCHATEDGKLCRVSHGQEPWRNFSLGFWCMSMRSKTKDFHKLFLKWKQIYKQKSGLFLLAFSNLSR